MAAVQLCCGKEIERGGEQPNPGSTADGVKQESAGRNARPVEQGGEKTEQQWGSENDVRALCIGEARNDLRVQDTVGESRNCENEAHERARAANIKESTRRANRGTNQDEGAESANQRRKGNEERVAGANAVMAAGEEVAEFMCEENREQSESEREPRSKSGGMFVEETEGAGKIVERGRLIV